MSEWQLDPVTGFQVRESGSAPHTDPPPATEETTPEDIREQVIRDKGLTPAQAARLHGTTREELEADADEVLQVFPNTSTLTTWGDVGQGADRGGWAGGLPPLDQLKDHRVFMANKDAILAALKDPYSIYNRGF